MGSLIVTSWGAQVAIDPAARAVRELPG